MDAPEDSPDRDLRSSVSRPLGGDDAVDEEEVMRARDSSDMDRSRGESGT